MGKVGLRKKGWEFAAILFCVAVLCFGISQKEGYHMDELLSFELANAQFNPWIVPTQPQGRLAKFVANEISGESFSETVKNLMVTVKDVLNNKGNSLLLSYQADVYEEPVWISREQFHDYITVDGKDAFQYLSVYFNVKDDNHPPLHFMALHTVSSLFWGQITPFMGCVVNLAAMAGVMLLLMKLGRRFAILLHMEEKARFLGIFAALLYGLSAGAMATTLLIRMYGMVTFFCVAFFDLCMEKWQEGSFAKKNFLLIAVAVLGFWTQYFFLFYCILLVAVTVVLLLLEKRFRECLGLVRSMIIAGAVGLMVFPFAISDVFSSSRGVEALGNLGEGLSGYGERLAGFFGIFTDRTFSGFLWVLAAMTVMCLVWKLGGYVRRREHKAETQGNEAWTQIGIGTGAVMLAAPAVGYFLLAARMSPYLVDRYIMPVFPFAALAGALLLAVWTDMAGRYLGEKGRRILAFAVFGTALLVQAVNLAGYDGSYLYKGYGKQEQIAREYQELPCICIYEGTGYYENLPEFTHYEKTLLLKPQELAERKDKSSVSGLEEAVVLVKPGAEWEQVQGILEESYGLRLKKELLAGGVHGDRIFLVGR